MAASACYVVGDIHGCVHELDRLLDQLAPSADDSIVFLGDYIDRGPDSAGVIERLLRLRCEVAGCVFLKGNHEDMFSAFLGYEGQYGEAFLYNGGGSTLRSYGVENLSPGDIAARLPPAHLEFLRSLKMQHEIGEFLCVHAGLDPGRSLAAQTPEDMLWIRGPFIDQPHPFPFTVLFGHTPCREVIIDLPYKLGIDTGLVYGNKLTCFEITKRELWQLERGGRRVERRSLAAEFAGMPRR